MSLSDMEVRRAILEHAHKHRNDHPARHVLVGDILLIKGTEETRLSNNMEVLRDEGLIEIHGMNWELVSITTRGIRLVEDPRAFNREFPLRYDVPKQTKDLAETVEELLHGRFDPPLRQFLKAKSLLYDHQPPDLLNSVKDAVGAVEGYARVLLGEPKKVLGDLSGRLREQYLGHPAMKKVLDGLGGVRGDEPGAAHGATEMSGLGYADAEFILNTSASVLICLARKAQPR